jgi:hypothetical protein
VLQKRLVLVALALLAGASSADASPADEYAVKAAMVYNFAKFVEWPARETSDEPQSLRLCVLADGPVRQSFEALAGRSVSDRILEVRAVSGTERTDGCQILYISAPSLRSATSDILSRCAARPILTVSDVPDFAAVGGMIGLTTVERKIRFEIHLGAAEAAGLVLSSRLLALAVNVHRGTQGARR